MRQRPYKKWKVEIPNMDKSLKLAFFQNSSSGTRGVSADWTIAR